MINVTKPSLPPLNEFVDEIEKIWQSGWLTNMGAEHQEFEKEIQKYLKVENVELFVNGHLALELALQAFSMEKGGEVITTPFTFASTTHAIIRNNLKPVFCDIRCDDFTIDACKIEELITDKTVAIMPVHVYGNVCRIEDISKIANKYNLRVIYDAAHAFGIKIGQEGIGMFGDCSMFSFHATKVFNSIEGGCVTFSNANMFLKSKLYNLKNFGIQNQEDVIDVGCNAKMNEFQAAMGLCNLRHIDENIAKRKIIIEEYRKELSMINGIEFSLQNSKDIQGNYSYAPILVDETQYSLNRDELFDILRQNGFIVRKYFYPLTCDFTCYQEYGKKSDVPNARYIANRILTLPVYADMKIQDVEEIIEIIKRYA